MLKKAQVIMLPHNDNNAKITLYKTASGKPLNLSTNTDILAHHTNQHLYIILEDEIKEGDWCIYNNRIVKYNKPANPHFYKKIIATTDTSLNKYCWNCNLLKENPTGLCIRCSRFGDTKRFIPQPSPQFIEKYIESYNKVEIITDVLVEYSPSSITIQTYSEQQINDNLKALTLKINPKDNTITIKKLKDSWNRGDVIEQMWLAYKAANTIFEDESALRVEFNNWIDKNL